MPTDLKYGKVTLQRGSVESTEPVFILRARDTLAEKYIRMYAEECRGRGCSANHYSNVLNAAEKFRDWPTKKLPG